MELGLRGLSLEDRLKGSGLEQAEAPDKVEDDEDEPKRALHACPNDLEILNRALL